MKNYIKFSTSTDFYEGIQQMVMLGLTFRADHDSLTIYLLGGF